MILLTSKLRGHTDASKLLTPRRRPTWKHKSPYHQHKGPHGKVHVVNPILRGHPEVHQAVTLTYGPTPKREMLAPHMVWLRQNVGSLYHQLERP